MMSERVFLPMIYLTNQYLIDTYLKLRIPQRGLLNCGLHPLQDPCTMSSGALERRLRAGEFAITAEITPPVSADPAHLLERALPLKGLADAVNVTDGASAALTWTR